MKARSSIPRTNPPLESMGQLRGIVPPVTCQHNDVDSFWVQTLGVADAPPQLSLLVSVMDSNPSKGVSSPYLGSRKIVSHRGWIVRLVSREIKGKGEATRSKRNREKPRANQIISERKAKVINKVNLTGKKGNTKI